MFIEIHNQNLTFVVVAWFPSSLIWVVLYLKIMEAAWFCVYWNWEYQLELEKKHKELEDFQKHCFIFIGFWLYFYIFHSLFCFCIVRILVESKQGLNLHHFVSFTHCSSVSCLKNLWDEIMLSFIYTSKIFFVWEIDFR